MQIPENIADRQAAAERALNAYDFGESIVESRNGWEYTQIGREYTCTIFFEDPEGGDTLKGHFTAVFESETSDKVIDAYAMLHGNLVGQLPAASPGP